MLNAPLKIDAEFKAVCPPLAEEERKELAASIKKDGCREAIRTWRGYIIDGHNRYEICEELHCSYVSREVLGLNSRAEVIAWIIRNQFGRRNLNAMQRAELALKLKEAVAAEAKARKVKAGKEHGRGKEKHPPTLAEPKSETRDELAKVAGVSHGTLAKVEKIVTQAAPAVVEAARKGEISINAAFKTVAPKTEQNPSPLSPVVEPADIKVRCSTKAFSSFSKKDIIRRLSLLATKLKVKQDEESTTNEMREFCARLLDFLSGAFGITVISSNNYKKGRDGRTM